MGAYLSEPLTTKESADGSGNGLSYGASAMQGWRASQEDAHHCIADFDKNSSLYSVFDGHGGGEVAEYIAKAFPDLLKNTTAYTEGNFEQALHDAFLQMDASIKEPEVLKTLQKIAKGGDSNDAMVDYEEENVVELYEEATMPLERLVAKYHSQLTSVLAANSKEDESQKPCSSSSSAGSLSSMVVKTEHENGAGPSSRSPSPKKPAAVTEPGMLLPSTSIEITDAAAITKSDEEATNLSANTGVKTNGDSALSGEDDDDLKKLVAGTVKEEPDKENAEINGVSSSSSGEELKKLEVDTTTTKEGQELEKENVEGIKLETKTSNDVKCNGTGSSNSSGHGEVGSNDPSSEMTDAVTLSSTASEVSIIKPRKGKVHPTPIIKEEVPSQPSKPKRARGTLKALMEMEDSSDLDTSSSEEEEDDSEDQDEEESSESDGEDDEDSDEDAADDSFLSGVQEPGFDSGTTAVVSLLRWEDSKLHLWVANAGDSRCVVSRGGQAVDMSHDHKPESEEETLRIIKAGGKVTDDGRVNGGLNLSRALGDHSYKQNETLTPEEQMISAVPTIQHIELELEKDEFIILACDGVWNSFTSQEVVDFVRERITKASSLSEICEELFHACLADDTCGDGTGCDNMTAIIVQLNKEMKIVASNKRTIDEVEDSEEANQSGKRTKLELDTSSTAADPADATE